MQITIRPLTPDLWPALEDLFGESGAVGGCWCMYWRIGRAIRTRPGAENKAAFRDVVMRGPPPGLIAFACDLAVGWCQLTPRDAIAWLDRTWRLKRVDDLPVWSLSCLYVRKGYRRQGVSTALIAAALEAARRAGAPALEAYPLDADKIAERHRHRPCLDLRPRRVQNRRPSGVASPGHAPRPEGVRRGNGVVVRWGIGNR